MLCLSITTNIFYRKIFLLFKQPYENTTTSLAYNELQESIITRKLRIILPLYLSESNEQKDTEQKSFIITSDERVKSYAKDTKFAIYFKSRLEKCVKRLDKIDKDIPINNAYFNPELFNLISNRLHYVAFWSGLLIGHFQKKHPRFQNLTRLSNNPVEGWFKILKNNLLLGRKKVSAPYLITILE